MNTELVSIDTDSTYLCVTVRETTEARRKNVTACVLAEEADKIACSIAREHFYEETPVSAVFTRQGQLVFNCCFFRKLSPLEALARVADDNKQSKETPADS